MKGAKDDGRKPDGGEAQAELAKWAALAGEAEQIIALMEAAKTHASTAGILHSWPLNYSAS